MDRIKKFKKMEKTKMIKILLAVILFTAHLFLPVVTADSNQTNETNETTENFNITNNVFSVSTENENTIIYLIALLLTLSLALFLIDLKLFSAFIVVITGFIILTNLNAFIIALIVILAGIILIFKL